MLLRFLGCKGLFLFSLLVFLSSIAVAQDGDDRNRLAGFHDNPAARLRWFNQGRQTRNGKKPAEMRMKAYRQKMQMRATQQQAIRAEAKSNVISTPGATNAWIPLGPVPINDSTVVPTGYGPLAGRVTAIAVDQKDTTGNTVYAAGAYGGVWKSTNAAAVDPSTVRWTPIMDDQATLAVGSIALQPGNSNLILVGTGEPNYAGDSYYGVGILRSTDGGATWTANSSVTYGGQYFGLFGMGISQIAFSTKNPNFVVAAVSAYTLGAFSLNAISSNGVAGLIYSSDGGANWTLAPWTDDGGTNLYSSSVSSVVYNPTEDKFYAAIPFHGFYVSNGTASGGFTTFRRMASQPGSAGALSATACPAPGSSKCPLLRGTLTVRPVQKSGDPNQMFAWFVSDGNGDAKDDMGIWQYSLSGSTASWKQITDTSITNCGDAGGCGTKQSFYNLYIAAVPNGSSGTDLYAGTINIYKCSISSANPTCAATPFQNLTHVYGCSSISMVHPDQHALDFLLANPNVVYFGNDGGVNRTLYSQSNLKTGTCPAGNTKANAFDNLNMNIGALTQFVWGAQHPTDATTIMGGTQDNGTMGTSSAAPAPGELGWWEVDNGDGGYTQIDPANPANWYTEYYGVSVQYCPGKGINCNAGDFNWLVAESNADNLHQVDGDDSNFYMPYILDPADPTKLILGTCRVWRGPNDPTKWPNYSTANALSHKLLNLGDTACNASSGDDLIAGLAAGGPSTAAGSQVIWASTTGGHVYMTKNATSGVATWSEVTGTLNYYNFQISAIAVDPRDPTGMTAIIGTQGYPGQVFRTTDGGNSWFGMSNNLPGAPINDLAFDPDDSGTIYAATDVGVYVATNYLWQEVGPQNAGDPGYLPNVAVFHIAIFRPAGDKRLRAWTHGRGVWEVPLDNFPHGVVAIPSQLGFAQKVTTKSPPSIVTLTNHDLVEVTLGSPAITGADPSVFAIDQATTTCGITLAAGATCNIGVTFSPLDVRDYYATVTLTTTGLRTPTIDILMRGVGQFVGVTIDPPSMSVYSVVGVPNSSDPITIQNHDLVPVTINMGFSGPDAADFVQTTPVWCVNGQTLAVEELCLATIQFTAPSVGTFAASFDVTTTSTITPTLSTTLTGIGMAAVRFSPDSIIVSSKQGVGITRAISVTNVSPNPVTLGSVSITGPGAAAYSIDNSNGGCPSPLPGGVTCGIWIVFTPPSVGTFTATASFTTSGAGTPLVSVTLNGTGTTPDVSDFAYDFGSSSTSVTVKAGQSATYNFNIQTTPPNGNFYSSLVLTCAGNPNKTSCAVNPAGLASSGPATLTITTTAPSAAQPVPGSLARRIGGGAFAALFLPGFMYLAIGRKARSRRQRLLTYLAIACTFAVLLTLVACGGGGGGASTPPRTPIPGTPVGTYKITISGEFYSPATGNVTRTQDVTLIVQ